MEPAWVIATLMACLGVLLRIWHAQNEKRHDGHTDGFKEIRMQVRIVEQESISRDTMNNIQNDWRDEIALLREERKENHTSNTSRLDKMDDKLDRIIDWVVDNPRQGR